MSFKNDRFLKQVVGILTSCSTYNHDAFDASEQKEHEDQQHSQSILGWALIKLFSHNLIKIRLDLEVSKQTVGWY